MKQLMKDKRGLEFKSAFYALIVFSTIIIAAGVIIGEWDEDYGSGLTYDLDEYNEAGSVSETAGTQQAGISVSSSGKNENFEDTSIRGVFGVLNNVFQPLRVVFGDNGMIDSLTNRFGIPDYIRQLLVTMMVIAIVWALVAVIFRRPTRSA